MPMDWDTFDVPFRGGLDEKTDPRQVETSRLQVFENAYQQRTGEVRKRNGSTQLTSITFGAAAINEGRGLCSVRDELILFDKNSAFSFSESIPAWKPKGGFPPSEVSAKPIAQLRNQADKLDIARKAPWICYTYAEPDAIASGQRSPRITVIDEVTGTEVLSDEVVASPASFCAVIPSNSTDEFILVYVPAAGGTGSNIEARLVTSLGGTAVAVGGATTLVTNRASGVDFAVIPGASGEFVVAYEDTTGDVRVESFTNALASSNSFNYTPTISPVGEVRISTATATSGGPDIVVSYIDSTTPKALRLVGSSLANVWTSTERTLETPGAGEAAIVSTCVGVDPSASSPHSTQFFYTLRHTTTDEARTRTANISEGGTVSGVTGLRRNSHVVSDGVADKDKTYVFVAVNEPARTDAKNFDLSTIHLMDDSGSSVARALVAERKVERVGTLSVFDRTNRHVIEDSGVFTAPFMRADALSLRRISAADYDEYLCTLVGLSVDVNRDGVECIEVQGGMEANPGVTTYYDGDRMVADGIMQRHPQFVLETTNTGGTLSNGTYGVAAVYLWKDGNGNEWYSAPTFQTITLNDGGSSVVQTINVYQTTGTVDWALYNGFDSAGTNGKQRIRILFYRTQVDDPIFYLEGELSNVTASFNTSLDLGLDSDATISQNAVLRTTGGVLASTAPPSFHHIASGGDYLVGIQADNRENILVSKPLREGIGVEWPIGLTFRVSEGGDAEACQLLDGRMVIFKKKEIRTFLGSPPNALGQGGFSGTQQVSSDVGCINWRSVVLTPLGTAFKSSKGIYLLDRSLQVKYIGAPVEGHNGDTITSGVLLEDQNQVRWTTSAGEVLVWEYYQNNWSVFTGISATDATVWKGKWTYVDSGGDVFQEDTSYTDGASATYEVRTRSDWVKFTGLQGYQRIRRVGINGEVRAPVSLTVNIYGDYDASTILQTETIDLTSASAGDVLLERIRLDKQKLTSAMVEIRYTTDAEGVRLSSLSFEYGRKRGIGRTAPSATL